MIPVPIVGGINYVRTGVMKWWLGGVVMGGAYMVCGMMFPPVHSSNIVAREVNRPKTKVHGYELTTGPFLRLVSLNK